MDNSQRLKNHGLKDEVIKELTFKIEKEISRIDVVNPKDYSDEANDVVCILADCETSEQETQSINNFFNIRFKEHPNFKRIFGDLYKEDIIEQILIIWNENANKKKEN